MEAQASKPTTTGLALVRQLRPEDRYQMVSTSLNFTMFCERSSYIFASTLHHLVTTTQWTYCTHSPPTQNPG